MNRIIEEAEIYQGVYIGKDKKGKFYYSGYFESNNGNRRWSKIEFEKVIK